MRPSQDSDHSYYYDPLAAAAQGFVFVLLRFEVVAVVLSYPLTESGPSAAGSVHMCAGCRAAGMRRRILLGQCTLVKNVVLLLVGRLECSWVGTRRAGCIAQSVVGSAPSAALLLTEVGAAVASLAFCLLL